VAGSVPLTEDEIQEFADVFVEPSQARQLLDRAGFSRNRQPGWNVSSSEDFWREVSRRLGDGALPDGRARLLATAAGEFPENAVFGAPAKGRSAPASQNTAATGCGAARDARGRERASLGTILVPCGVPELGHLR
jgi:hypothetical protein